MRPCALLIICVILAFSSIYGYSYIITNNKLFSISKKLFDTSHSQLISSKSHQLITKLYDSSSKDASVNPASSNPAPKGFAKAKETKEVKSEIEVDTGTKTYEIQAKRGVPEYNIFIRPSNGSDTDWIPVGSMTIPRDTKVSKAVFEVEAELLKGTYKLYPKLKAYAELRKDKNTPPFEYGYVLKAFPDEPIVLIKPEVNSGGTNFFTNWLGKITNPIDTSELKQQGQIRLKQ